MVFNMVASHSISKAAQDSIFGAAGAASAAKAKYGPERVVDGTLGVILDENEQLVCLPPVERVFRSLPINELIAYAPIAGLPDYLDTVIEAAFLDNKPEAYIKSVATAGGLGSIHHAVWNYSEFGDTILTSDWFWDPYRVLAECLLRKIDTYQLFDGQNQYNVRALELKVNELLAKQNSLLVIINTPAHNPVGYSLSNDDWDKVIEVMKTAAQNTAKKITVFVDMAYIDFAGEKNDTRAFLKKFGNLPKNLLVIVSYSMSKGFTIYGMRCGAMLGISSDQGVAQEFFDANQYTSRATWSNTNRGAMSLLTTIYKDKALLAEIDAARAFYFHKIKERADAFTAEAKAAKLVHMPYIAGFFLSVPTQDSFAVSKRLYDDNIFIAPLAKGVRVALCAIPVAKVKGMAAKIAAAIQAVDQ